MILRKYGLRHVDDLLGLAYGANAKFANWDEVAGLAPLVFEVRVLACLRPCALSRALVSDPLFFLRVMFEPAIL